MYKIDTKCTTRDNKMYNRMQHFSFKMYNRMYSHRSKLHNKLYEPHLSGLQETQLKLFKISQTSTTYVCSHILSIQPNTFRRAHQFRCVSSLSGGYQMMAFDSMRRVYDASRDPSTEKVRMTPLVSPSKKLQLLYGHTRSPKHSPAHRFRRFVSGVSLS